MPLSLLGSTAFHHQLDCASDCFDYVCDGDAPDYCCAGDADDGDGAASDGCDFWQPPRATGLADPSMGIPEVHGAAFGEDDVWQLAQ